ncbi:NAD(P)-dependent oxidoreductase [Goodfellowiella coeruleoviolacea]|uniref:NAD(P)-dependent oxidoreductase n=1 Tax=Goodfellowiella coeruleoviolacea TaxID=334858 RepID=UPI000A9B2E0E|nr:NAD(P)-dependent oxidoreductase [Goodfellowiella coeruleoviolacea]
MKSTRLAFIGLGNMGSAMAHRLVATGYPVTVHNRTAAKAAPVVAAGARPADSARQAVRDAEVVLVSLSDEAAVEQVVFDQVLADLRPGALVVDTSTVSPEYAVAAATRLEQAGARRVEACVVGNPRHARAGELRVFTAGDERDVVAVRPILEVLGTDVVYLGPPGRAATLKLVFNLVLGAQLVALAEAVGVGAAAGLDPDLVLSAIVHSGFSSRVMGFRAELMRQHRYEPAFFRSGLMAKDLGLGLAAAGARQDEFPVLRGVLERYRAVVDAGDGDKDAAVVLEHVQPH